MGFVGGLVIGLIIGGGVGICSLAVVQACKGNGVGDKNDDK